MPDQLRHKVLTEDDETRWQAVVHRKQQADGIFYYAVSSTGIYCRPTCPARRPQRAHVAFFATTLEASQAGYRPCRRCRPDEVSQQQQTVARLRQLLESEETIPTLKALGHEVSMSPFHLQRLFKRQTGMSPKQYGVAIRNERFKQALKSGSSVTAAVYEAGYGSSRSVYDTAGAQLGIPPSSYREGGRGQLIHYGVASSPAGGMVLAATKKGVCALRFGAEGTVLEELRAEFPHATWKRDDAEVACHIDATLAYLRDSKQPLWLPLDVQSTDFQRRVWSALQQIPAGERRSYGEIAAAIGQPGAARAVARACAVNPVSLAIRCHRVVRANGSVGGFRWGSDRKTRLLAGESLPSSG